MPNCDFYATGQDHRAVLEFLFEDARCDVYEKSPDTGKKPARPTSITEFEEAFDIEDWGAAPHRWITLQLYAHGSGGPPPVRRVALSPRPRTGPRHRFTVEGWGLIQLYLTFPGESGLGNSHTNHNSEQRARNWADVCPELRSPALWDWKAVTSFSRRLNRRIAKMSVEKIGSRPVLPGAARLRDEGLRLA